MARCVLKFWIISFGSFNLVFLCILIYRRGNGYEGVHLLLYVITTVIGLRTRFNRKCFLRRRHPITVPLSNTLIKTQSNFVVVSKFVYRVGNAHRGAIVSKSFLKKKNNGRYICVFIKIFSSTLMRKGQGSISQKCTRMVTNKYFIKPDKE